MEIDSEGKAQNAGYAPYLDYRPLTENEILTALNKEDNFILALVQVPADENFSDRDAFAVREATGHYQVVGESCVVCYVEKPFQREPDWGASSVNYSWKEMWERGTKIKE